MVSTVSGYDLSGGTLLAMGRDVLRLGNSVWLIDLAPNGQVQLLRSSGFEVGGGLLTRPDGVIPWHLRHPAVRP